ncbi:hypothetical protein EB796_023619 [Bugula neritina]|uniref:Uncharacterized protein n=1 Tax=Bugula neritina TaxID=10212 RepID=A0A7J7IXW9_BUGNE|nr:hypothetical protein EB796_023619 [Bugula neritina]
MAHKPSPHQIGEVKTTEAVELFKFMKSNRKTKDAKEEALFNMRKTNSSAQEATKKIFAASIAKTKQRQLYFDKLTSIYIVLCTMMNMKQSHLQDVPISWEVMKKLRAKPQPIHPKKSNVTGIQLLKKKSQLAAIYRAKTSKKFQSPLIQLTKYGILPDIPSHRNTNKGRDGSRNIPPNTTSSHGTHTAASYPTPQ